MPFAPVTTGLTHLLVSATVGGEHYTMQLEYVARDIHPDMENYKPGEGPGLHGDLADAVGAVPGYELVIPAGALMDSFGNSTDTDADIVFSSGG
jgi:hypothetical protein